MKRKTILLISAFLIAISPLAALSQTGLNINRIFTDSFRGKKGVTETVLNHKKLKSKYNLSLYHSLTITGHPDLASEIEPLLTADGAKAKSSGTNRGVSTTVSTASTAQEPDSRAISSTSTAILTATTKSSCSISKGWQQSKK